MSDVSRMRSVVTESVMAQVADPAQWLRALRVIAERLKLNPARCLPLGGEVTLETAAFKLLEEAEKHRRTEDDVHEALSGMGVK